MGICSAFFCWAPCLLSQITSHLPSAPIPSYSIIPHAGNSWLICWLP